MDVIHSMDIAGWGGAFSESERAAAIAALESGKVLFFPHLAFALREDERVLLSPEMSNGRAKNISLDPSGKLKHAASSPAEFALLQAMMRRFAEDAQLLIADMFPGYRERLERARTSYRPVEIAGRSYSPTNDDTRLHIDAFPTRPMRGRRILRLFSNVSPNGNPRVWNVGEPFAAMAGKLLPRVKKPNVLKPWLLAATGATRGVRSTYDNLMLGLHDAAKLDTEYQRATAKTEIKFPPGSTWACFTDQVMHAALSGQFVLEQTFHLDIEAMAEPARAPIRILEEITGRKLS